MSDSVIQKEAGGITQISLTRPAVNLNHSPVKVVHRQAVDGPRSGIRPALDVGQVGFGCPKPITGASWAEVCRAEVAGAIRVE